MRRYNLKIKNKNYVLDVEELSADQFRVMLGDQTFEVQLTANQDVAQARITPQMLPARAGDESAVERPAISYHPPAPDSLEPPPSVPAPALPKTLNDASDDITAPMPGTILSIAIQPGDAVTRGQTILVLEAIKMKNAIKSPRDGVIARIVAQPGQTVRYGDVLAQFGEA